MSDTVQPGKEDKNGWQKTTARRLKAWEIAVLPICRRDGQIIDVHRATHAEFQAFIERAKIPFNDNNTQGIWLIDDRCAIINKALSEGRNLPFEKSENEQKVDFSKGDKAALQANGD